MITKEQKLPVLEMPFEELGNVFPGYLVKNYPLHWDLSNDYKLCTFEKLMGKRLLNFFRSISQKEDVHKYKDLIHKIDFESLTISKEFRWKSDKLDRKIYSLTNDSSCLFFDTCRFLRDSQFNFKKLGSLVVAGYEDYREFELEERYKKPINPFFLLGLLDKRIINSYSEKQVDR